MSKALPGSHFCANHQGNHSHYDPQNCELCIALAGTNEKRLLFLLHELRTEINSWTPPGRKKGRENFEEILDFYQSLTAGIIESLDEILQPKEKAQS